MRTKAVAGPLFALCLLTAACVTFGAQGGGSPSPGSLDSGAPGAVLFVSAEKGNDGNDGRDTARPLRTVGAALSRATSDRTARYEIRVCRGLYQEGPLSVTIPVALHGGYDCTTWQLPSDYGAAGVFGPIDETVLSARPLDAPRDVAFSLTLVGAAVDANTDVAGLRIVAPADATNASALFVNDGAAPHLHDLVIEGGRSSGTFVGGEALRIKSASPEVEFCRVVAGSGASDSVGAIGLRVEGGAPNVHDNEIRAGSGDAPQGTFALFLSNTTMRKQNGNALRNNRILVPAFQYRTPAGASVAAVALYIYASQVDVLDSDVYIDAVTCTGECLTIAIFVNGASDAHLARNRIFAGDVGVTDPSPPTPRNVIAFALKVTDESRVYAEANGIHAGSTRTRENSTRLGIASETRSYVQASGNTIFAGYDSVPPVFVSALVTSVQPTGRLALDGNLLIGGNGSTGIFALTCDPPGNHVTHLRQNTFLDMENDVVVGGPELTPSCARNQGALTLITNGDVVGNVSAPRATCGSCVSQLFSSWAPRTARELLFSAAGWLPRTNASCMYLAGGYAPLVGSADRDGRLRPNPPTRGAWEVSGCL